ncbi:MAG: helix-turn-helix domain-containing protein [Bacteroidota bacterium]
MAATGHSFIPSFFISFLFSPSFCYCGTCIVYGVNKFGINIRAFYANLIVRFNAVLNNLSEIKSLTEICYENNFFDQAHFIKDFKQFTGETPENFKRFL